MFNGMIIILNLDILLPIHNKTLSEIQVSNLTCKSSAKFLSTLTFQSNRNSKPLNQKYYFHISSFQHQQQQEPNFPFLEINSSNLAALNVPRVLRRRITV